ncbi:alkaline phosphatase PhoX [Phenylobacterium sp.]|uniref:alkaline phosphatase PhoX n=1 Tax=Phenylobacterium sp. TaxID=1871053 RepID=UPI0039834858
MAYSRRSFLALAATSAAFAGVPQAFGQTGVTYRNEVTGYGPLIPDPKGLFELPEGFSYRVISEAGQRMDDGLLTPDKMDGMGCFPAGRGRVALVRNHELRPTEPGRSAFGADGALAAGIPADRVFDRTALGHPMPGGTTTLIYDLRAGRLVSQHLSLAGTSTNCAGGLTPWGSWLTCEETTLAKGPGVSQDHGWVFEVPADARGLVEPHPIRAMGRFRHEAAAIDPRTGVVYLTEDTADSLIYRYLPNDRRRLHSGGRLQALGFREGAQADPRNKVERFWSPGDWRDVVWIDLDGVESPADDLRLRGAARGAARFARGEGLWFGDGELFITCTSGGPAAHGQILRYVPSRREGRPGEADRPGRLQLFVEPSDPAVMSMADNIAVAPWGHLFVCEDKGVGQNQLKAVTPKGQVYAVGRNVMASPQGVPINTELAGVCFSPDGATLFVNLYMPGKTLAITGPWNRFRA